MISKILCMVLALLFAAAANLRLCWTAGAGGETADGTYSLAACVFGMRAAEAAADELLEGRGAPPGLELRPRLSIRSPTGAAGAVSDLLLRHTEGVTAALSCRAGEAELGCCADGAALREALRRSVFEARPPGALSGHYTDSLSLRTVYTRSDRTLSAEALAAQVNAAVPVIYVDSEGAVVAG